MLAGLLVSALGSGTLAQSPSPEPPPWFGGRVEMPEHGFAVTLPDDWVAFDTAGDTESQLEAASGFLGTSGWPVEDTELVDAFASAAASGGGLVLAHAASTSKCQVRASRGAAVPVEGYAELMYGAMVAEPRARDVEPPQRIDLPGGPAYLVRGSRQPDPGVDEWGSMSGYLLATDEVVLVLGCTTDDASPDDDWLSIAESIELEGGPPATSSDRAEALIRVEVPEATVALELPESWTVDIEMEEISRVDMEPGELIGTSILVAYGPGHLPMCGLFVQESSEPLYWLPGVLEALASGRGAFREGEDHTPVPVELPAGTAVKVAHVSRSLVDWPLGFVEYFIAADDRFYVLFCATMPSLVPDDDWLSIAETFEFLPAEE